jgi:hypothetical protein
MARKQAGRHSGGGTLCDLGDSAFVMNKEDAATTATNRPARIGRETLDVVLLLLLLLVYLP